MVNICPKEDLESAGISLIQPNLQMGSQILAITYPEFEAMCNNLFKNYLSKDVFLSIKNKKTNKYNNTIRPTLQAAVENQNSRIGCYLTDSEAYETYQSLTNPIIEEINQGVNIKGFKYQKDYQSLRNLKENKLTTEIQYIKTFKFKVKRNLDGHAFNLVISNENREKIKEKIISALKKLNFDKFYLLEEMIEDEKKKFWINNKQYFNSKKNPFIRQGARYKDWPSGRAIALKSEKRYLKFFDFLLQNK